jgi:serine phosphatase RsbU (regulator of sigma subunit)
MSIRNRLLVLLLVIALTPLVFTSLLQQASIWVMRGSLSSRMREALLTNARQELQEQLQGDVRILEIDRQLAEAQLMRQVHEVEQRLAGITPPAAPRFGEGPTRSGAGRPFGEAPSPFPDPNGRDMAGRGGLRGGFPGDGGPAMVGRGARPGGSMSRAGFASVNTEFGLDSSLFLASDLQHSYFSSSKASDANAPAVVQTTASTDAAGGAADANAAALKVNYKAQTSLVARGENEALARQAMDKLADMTGVYRDICARGPTGILWLHTSLEIGLYTTYPGGATPRDLFRYNPAFEPWYRQALEAYLLQRMAKSAPPDANAPRSPNVRGRGGMGPMRDMMRQYQIGIEAMQGVLSQDPFTSNEQVVVRSLPITYADGSFAGAAAMVRTIPEIFSSLQLPERWGPDIKRMLILVDPNAVNMRGKIRVLLEEGGESNPSAGPGRDAFGPGGPGSEWAGGGSPRSGMPGPGRMAGPGRMDMGRRGGPAFGRGFPRMPEVRVRALSDDVNDSPELPLAIADILKDHSGVRQMEYKGRQCLLAYQPLDIPNTAAVLVVPYDKVVDFASTWEQSLVKESVRWLQVGTLLILVVAAAAVSLAAVKARNVTQPINALIEAGNRLGSGDYNAHVDIHTSDELEHLGRVFNEAGPKLRDHERMKRSLDLASAIQHSLMPARTPDMENFELASRCVYCDETGGDYYDFIRLPDSGGDGSAKAGVRIGLVIGDVSGHGIGAALLMAVTRGLLHAEAPHAGDDLAGLMARVNGELVRDTAEETFVTLFYGVLDDRQRSLVWASAGHEPATLYRAATRRIEELPNTGMLLGVLPTAVFRQAGPVTLAPGDILVVGTDGIWEAHDDDGHFFGKDRLHRIIEETAGADAEEICSRIIESVAMFVRPAPHSDDITLIVVKAR